MYRNHAILELPQEISDLNFVYEQGIIQMKYIDYVNIRHGTKSLPRFSSGNTVAATQLPFAMAGFSPQTSSERGNWFFHPDDRVIEGIRLTHQPSPWIGDYGHFCLQPQEGNVAYYSFKECSSGYRPEEAILQPDYLSIDFLRYHATFKLTPTTYGAAIHIKYHGNLQPRLALLPISGVCGYSMNAEKRQLTGMTKASSWPMASNFALYFVMTFDCEIDEKNCMITTPNGVMENTILGQGEGYGCNIALFSKEVSIRFATSYISVEQAQINLIRDHGDNDFDTVRQQASDICENWLSKIHIETKTEDQKKTFYSCLYRMFLYPHQFHEFNEDGDAIHYCTHDGSIAKGVLYTDNGFWDTYRTVYPMLSLIAPEKFGEILEGFVNIYVDSGWLPKWVSPGEIGAMPGTLIDAVIAHAAVTDSAKRDVLEKAFEGMLKHSTQTPNDKTHGRQGIIDYRKYGYVPRDRNKESVNHTLDYAYGDFCIAQTAKALGKDIKTLEFYEQSALNYRNIFDSETGFMRGKDVYGDMKQEFDPFYWGGEYCEGSAWQNSFAVYHDISGLAALHGGNYKLAKKLDELFATPPNYNVGDYGLEIHEMTEMAAVDFGQCAISNQPSFHLPYIYAAIGYPKKTDYWVEKLVREAFSSGNDGFPGDEDNGTMAGWYIFSTLGFYPLCPGKTQYVKCKKLVIKVFLNGKELKLDEVVGNFVEHADIISSTRKA